MKMKPKQNERTGVAQVTHFETPTAPSLLDELRGVPASRPGYGSWIENVPEDLVAQLREIAREYNSGTIRCSQRIIMERFLALCQRRGVEVSVGYNGFRGVFSQMRGKS